MRSAEVDMVYVCVEVVLLAERALCVVLVVCRRQIRSAIEVRCARVRSHGMDRLDTMVVMDTSKEY